jgi:hypothetical protein
VVRSEIGFKFFEVDAVKENSQRSEQMIKARVMIPVFALLASLVGCTTSRPRIISQEEFGNNYCHTKYRAPGGDIIDFYGPCDERSGDLAWKEHLFRQNHENGS